MAAVTKCIAKNNKAARPLFTLPFTRCRYFRTPPLSHAACASMSTTTSITRITTTTRDRGLLWPHGMGLIAGCMFDSPLLRYHIIICWNFGNTSLPGIITFVGLSCFTFLASFGNTHCFNKVYVLKLDMFCLKINGLTSKSSYIYVNGFCNKCLGISGNTR